MIWLAFALFVFAMVWLTIEIADEVAFIWRNGRTIEAVVVSGLVVAVGCLVLWITFAALDAWAAT